MFPNKFKTDREDYLMMKRFRKFGFAFSNESKKGATSSEIVGISNGNNFS